MAARFQVLATAVLFSTGGAVIKATSLSGWQVAGIRSGIAAAVLLLLLPRARRGWNWKIVLVGCAYASALTTYVFANKLTTAANTIFLFSAVPLYVLLLGPWLLKERFRRQDLLIVAVFVLGMTMVFLGSDSGVETAPKPLEGNLLALLGGFFFALTIMGLRWFGRDRDVQQSNSVAAVVVGNLIVFSLCLPLVVPVIGATAIDWMLVLYLGAIQVGLAYALLTKAVRWVPALEVSLLLLIEPVLNPLWAWWMLGEKPSGWAFAGGSLIILAIIGMTASAYLRSRPRLQPTD